MLTLFLKQAIDECPYTIEYAYSDNGKEYKGTDQHAFVKTCIEHGIGQKFTRCNRPQSNGKAERVIRTLIEMWHQEETFSSRQKRRGNLNRFINFYNVVKPHKGIDNIHISMDGQGHWIKRYNERRPHSRLDDKTPDEAYWQNPRLGYAGPITKPAT